jgi:predicted DNA-binding protein
MVIAKEKSITVPVRIPKKLAKNLDIIVKSLGYKSRNQIIKEALEQYVSNVMRAKIVEVEDYSVDEAAKKIDAFLSNNPGAHYVSEIAEALGLELNVAFKATQKIMDEGMAEVRER